MHIRIGLSCSDYRISNCSRVIELCFSQTNEVLQYWDLTERILPELGMSEFLPSRREPTTIVP